MTDTTHRYDVVHSFHRPHPLDVPSMKYPIDMARFYGHGAHIRVSPATYAAIKAAADGYEVRQPAYWLPTATALPPVLGVSVVVDPDMPDDEWRIAVWRF